MKREIVRLTASGEVARLTRQPQPDPPKNALGTGTSQMTFDARTVRGRPNPLAELDYWLDHEGEIGKACLQAFGEYRELHDVYPEYGQRDWAAFELAALTLKISPTEKSAAGLDEYARTHPRAEARIHALVLVGEYYFTIGAFDAAARALPSRGGHAAAGWYLRKEPPAGRTSG